MSEKSDRELLELAARAAGMIVGKFHDGWNYSSMGPYGEGFYKVDWSHAPKEINPRDTFIFWNPLRNNGDAFKTMVRHALKLDQDHPGFVVIKIDILELTFEEYVRDINDYEYATRRAIVRAAAAIGEKMP